MIIGESLALIPLPRLEDYTPEIPNQPTVWTDEEYELFSLVSRGEINAVKAFLQGYKTASVLNDKINEDGYTIWHVAIHNRNESMLKYLLTLQRITILYDLLLHAILEESLVMVTMIHKVIKERHPDVRLLPALPRWKYSRYLHDVTPMILAAEQGSYELIEYFHLNGEKLIDLKTIEHNSPLYERRASDAIHKPMELSKNYMMLHQFAAATSPEMLCYRILADEPFDLVLECIEFINILRDYDHIYHEHMDNFKELRKKIKEFLTNILDRCITMEEVKTFLKQKEGKGGMEDEYPRALLLIEKRIYSLITHPHFQKVLYSQWAGIAWPSWKRMSTSVKVFHIVGRIFIVPLICIWLFFDGWSKAAHFFRSPINRCMNDFASYIFFLGLLTYESHMLYTHDIDRHNTPCKPVEITIMLFVLGHVVALARRFIASPTQAFWMRWNWFECMQIFIFVLVFLFWASTWYAESIKPMPSNMTRYHWPGKDSVVCGEAFFAVAVVISYIRFMRFFQLNFVIGPTQIALASMVKDVGVFLVFFSIIGLSFAFGFYFMYSRFCTQKLNIGDNGAHVVVVTNDFGSYSTATQSLFWGLLGLADSDAAIFIDSNGDFGEQNGSAYLVQQVGRGLWMVYHLVATMILMNMLIGYLSNTLSAIQNNLEPTWMYNRSLIWIYYMRNTTLPPPFNIVPSVYSLKLVFLWLRRSTYPKYGDDIPACSPYRCCYLASKESPAEKRARIKEYRRLLHLLAQRYLRSKLQNQEQAYEPPQADIDSLKERISALQNKLQSAFNPGTEPYPREAPFPSTSRAASRKHMDRGWEAELRFLEDYNQGGSPLLSNPWIRQPHPIPSAIRQSFTPDHSPSKSSAALTGAPSTKHPKGGKVGHIRV